MNEVARTTRHRRQPARRTSRSSGPRTSSSNSDPDQSLAPPPKKSVRHNDSTKASHSPPRQPDRSGVKPSRQPAARVENLALCFACLQTCASSTIEPGASPRHDKEAQYKRQHHNQPGELSEPITDMRPPR